jgi:hypothetical protein
MTLAVAILFFSISLISIDLRCVAQSTPQADSASAPATSQQGPSTQANPAASKPGSPSPSQAPVTKPKESATKKTQKKKVVSDPNCNPAPAKSNSAGSNTSGPTPQTGSTAGTPPATQKNCPPAKIVVRQGGITEQSIQLAGGSSGGEATGKRQSTNQMLTATEENLKKASSIQLSMAQQTSVSQIRQFVDESKKALKAADFERAQTLAWKAKVLSDDLISPKN